MSAQAETALGIVGSLEQMVGAHAAGHEAAAPKKATVAASAKNVVSLVARQPKPRPTAKSAEEAIPMEGTGTFGSF